MAAQGNQKPPQTQKESKPSTNKSGDSSTEETFVPADSYKKIPEEVLFEWKAQARPFEPKGRKFWTTSVSIAVIFGSFLYIIEGAMPVFVIIAFMFLYYVLTTVKPGDVEYKITNFGIRFAEKLTEWPFMLRFWFTQRGNSHLLVVDTVNLPGRIEMVINPKDKQKISDVMIDYLDEEEASPSGFERAADWFSKKMPNN